MLFTLGRAEEVFAGGRKVVKDVGGRRLLVVWHKDQLYAVDSHCYHMGGDLEEGDIEDVDQHACVVCPLHRHRIDLRTGHRVETDLCGGICESKNQKQRVYQVYTDGDKIQVYIPDTPPQDAPLPSDRYNYWNVQQAAATPPRRNAGLFGTAVESEPHTPQHLEPYAGMSLTQSPAGAGGDSPAAAAQNRTGQAPAQSQIQFRAQRARAAMARAAVLNNKRDPPLADRPAARGLGAEFSVQATTAGAAGAAPGAPGSGGFGLAAAPPPAAAQAPVQARAGNSVNRQASLPGGQRTLFDLWGRAAAPEGAAGAPQAMDTE